MAESSNMLEAWWLAAVGGLEGEWRNVVDAWAKTEGGRRVRHELAGGSGGGPISRPVFPAPSQIFRALKTTPLHSVRAVILGQDPYHTPGMAEGLAFSVPAGQGIPPSLRNIFLELGASYGIPFAPAAGHLGAWAADGVLLLNNVLTVPEGQAAGHRGLGWESLTAALLDCLARSPQPIAFLFWGRDAQAHSVRIVRENHSVFEAPHPSPLSAYRGFFGSRPFTSANAHLTSCGAPPVAWDAILPT